MPRRRVRASVSPPSAAPARPAGRCSRSCSRRSCSRRSRRPPLPRRAASTWAPASARRSASTQFRIEEEIGFYVDEQPSGFFFAFTPSQSFGADYWALTFAARFGYMLDIYRGRDIGFQLGPTVTVPGIGLGSFFDSMRDVDVYFHFSVALAVRLLLDSGRIAIYVRPVDFEFGFGDGHLPLSDDSVARYVLVAGVQLHVF